MSIVQPFGFLAPAAGGGQPVTDGILYYYNGSAESFQTPTSTDWTDIGGVNNLTMVATGPDAVTFDGKSAWNFDSANEELIGTVNSTQTITGYTVEAWIVYDGGKITSEDKGMIFQLMWKSSNQDNATYATLGLSGAIQGKFQAYIASATSNRGHHSANTAVTQNVWQHVAYTIEAGSSGNLIFYTNGSSDGSYNVPFADIDLTGASGFTNRMGLEENNNRQYSGYIGVVRAYSRALTSDEILQNYNAGVI